MSASRPLTPRRTPAAAPSSVFRTAALALALSLGAAVFVGVPQASAATTLKPEDEVKALITKWVDAYNSGKIDVLDKTFSDHEDVWIVGPVAGDEVWGRAAWKRAVEATFPMIPQRRMTTADVRVRMLRPDIAIVTGRWALDARTADDKPVQVRDGRFTTIVERRRGEWLVVSDHSSVGLPLVPPEAKGASAPAAPAAPSARPEDRPPTPPPAGMVPKAPGPAPKAGAPPPPPGTPAPRPR